MSPKRMLSVVGTAVGGIIGWSEPPPPVDPAILRALLNDVGSPPGEDLVAAVRAFQARTGLEPDGIAGPRTVHILVRYANQLRFAA